MQEETSLVGGGRVKDVGRIKIRGHADSDILSVLFQFSFVLRYEPCFEFLSSRKSLAFIIDFREIFLR